MVRLFNVYFPRRTLFLAFADYGLTCIALGIAVLLCLGAEAERALRYGHAALKVGLIGIVCSLCIYYCDAYHTAVVSNPREVPSRLMRGLGLASITLAALYYAFPATEIGRGFAVVGIFLIGVLLLAFRLAFFAVNNSTQLLEPTLILGEGIQAQAIAEEISKRPEFGFRLIGYLAETSQPGSDLAQTKRLGLVDELPQIVKREAVRRIIVAMGDRRSKMPVYDLLDLRMQGVQIEYGAALIEKLSGQIDVDELRPSWLIFRDGFPLRPKYWSARDILSKLLALSLLITVLPIIPIVIILVKLSAPGPVLYRQKRVGLRDRVFNCYKFRTMRADAEADCGPTWACDNDPRVTRVGRILRQTRLDEIPQLWNVLKGDMAFVGPRPERPEFIDELREKIPYYHLRHIIRPGITGWAQVRYKYGNTIADAKQKLKYDLFYIKHMSLSLDFWILFQTVKTVLFGRGAL